MSMNTDFLQQRPALLKGLLALYGNLSSLEANEHDMERLGDLIKDASRREFRLAVVGAFSRGKSTLVNALLGQELMSSGVFPTTAAAVEFRHSDVCRIVPEDAGSLDAIEEIPDVVTLRGHLERLSDQRKGSEYCKRGVRLRVDCPWPTLPDGLTLVDTPGLNSIHSEHDRITAEEVKNADGVLFLVATDPPLDEQEQHFYRTQIQARASLKTLCILTKVDLLNSHDEINEQLNYLREHLNLPEALLATVGLKGRKGQQSSFEYGVVKTVWDRIASEIIRLGPYQAKEENLKRRINAFVNEMLIQIAAEISSNGGSEKDPELEARTNQQRKNLMETEQAMAKKEAEAVANVTKWRSEGLAFSNKDFSRALGRIEKTNDVAEIAAIGQKVMNDVAGRLRALEKNVVATSKAFGLACEKYQQHRVDTFECQLDMPLAKRHRWMPAAGGLAAIPVAAAIASFFSPVTATTSTLLGSTALASAASWVGLAGLVTTTTVVAGPAVAIVGTIGLACGGAVALSWWLRDASNDQTEARKFVTTLLRDTRKAQEEAFTEHCDAIEEEIRGAVRDLVDTEVRALDALEGRRSVLEESHRAAKQRLGEIKRVLKDFQCST